MLREIVTCAFPITKIAHISIVGVLDEGYMVQVRKFHMDTTQI